MTIYQSDVAKGIKIVPQAFTKGAVVATTAKFTIPAGTTITSSDIIELAVLPAFHRIVDVKVIPTGSYSAATADIGIMSGEVGDKESARTSNDVIFADVALTGIVGTVAKADALVMATANQDRSIGVALSGSVVGAGQTLTLQLLLAAQ